MLVKFFFFLREAGLPVSLTEFLALLDGLDHRLVTGRLDDFYRLARVTLVKDESRYDRFDQAFNAFFEGVELKFEMITGDIPDDWLKAAARRLLTPQERAQIQKLGGFDDLMKTLAQRIAEQRGRHEGGNRWIGTGGTSPFGHGGFHPEGVRIGGRGEHGNAVNVWQNREYRNLADDRMLGTRNVKLALRRLRRFARQGRADQFSVDDTIDATARNGGLLDIKYRPPRRNEIKVLLFFDVGGSMDPYVRTCEDLFSAARSEFRHLEYFYFHNCVYERVWKNNERRRSSTLPVHDLTRTFSDEYKVIVVGDATMSPYEITHPGGSVEHFNEEPGAVWLRRLLAGFPNAVWLNPEPESTWDYTPSVKLIQELMDQRMFPMTLAGLDDAMARLRQTGVAVNA